MKSDQILDALFKRVQILVQTITILKGWSDPDVAATVRCARQFSCQIRTDIKCIREEINSIKVTLRTLKETKAKIQQLKLKTLYLEKNIPDRFNLPTDFKTSEIKQAEIKCSDNPPTPCFKIPSIVPKVQYLTLDEFQEVPKYMRGRLSYDEVNGFIDLFNSVLSKKYAIVRKKRASLKQRDAALWLEFKKQETPELKGMYFCVLNDFSSLGDVTFSKAAQTKMTILRHCGRMREVRTAGIVRFVAMY